MNNKMKFKHILKETSMAEDRLKIRKRRFMTDKINNFISYLTRTGQLFGSKKIYLEDKKGKSIEVRIWKDHIKFKDNFKIETTLYKKDKIYDSFFYLEDKVLELIYDYIDKDERGNW